MADLEDALNRLAGHDGDLRRGLGDQAKKDMNGRGADEFDLGEVEGQLRGVRARGVVVTCWNLDAVAKSSSPETVRTRFSPWRCWVASIGVPSQLLLPCSR